MNYIILTVAAAITMNVSAFAQIGRSGNPLENKDDAKLVMERFYAYAHKDVEILDNSVFAEQMVAGRLYWIAKALVLVKSTQQELAVALVFDCEKKWMTSMVQNNYEHFRETGDLGELGSPDLLDPTQ